MTGRRQFLVACAAAAGVAPLAVWLVAADGEPAPAGAFPVEKTDAEWRALLAPERYRVLREGRTERAFTSPLNHETRPGTYRCAGCGSPLFRSDSKYDSGTGWPSFWAPIEGAVGTRVDRAFVLVRTEVHCARCGSHLGHVFSDGPPPTGLRYCINGAALTFEPRRS